MALYRAQTHSTDMDEAPSVKSYVFDAADIRTAVDVAIEILESAEETVVNVGIVSTDRDDSYIVHEHDIRL